MGCVFSFFSAGAPYNLQWFNKKAKRSEEQEQEGAEAESSLEAGASRDVTDNPNKVDVDEASASASPVQAEQSANDNKDGTDAAIDAEELQEQVEAATKLQAGFRGYQTRKNLKNLKGDKKSEEEEEKIENENENNKNENETKNESFAEEIYEDDQIQAVTKLQAGFRGFQTRKQLKEKKLSVDPEVEEKNEPEAGEQETYEEDQIQAVTKLQAGFRGYQTRKQLKERTKGDASSPNDSKNDDHEDETSAAEQSEEVDVETLVDLDEVSEEQIAAATKLQAGFRGYQTRKSFKAKKLQSQEGEDASSVHADSPRPDIDKTGEKPEIKPRLISAPRSADATITTTTPTPTPTSPVLRRPKTAPGRSRVATSKYRSGLVLDSQMSMDEMEKEIESEMLNNAAVKIQAGFRGFRTRKSLGSYGVSKKGRIDEDTSSVDPDTIITDALTSPSCDSSHANAHAAAIAERLSPDLRKDFEGAAASAAAVALSRGATSGSGKPPLSCLRSRSYPGSHELEDVAEQPENLLDLVLDEGDEDRLLNLNLPQNPPGGDLQLDLDEPEIDLELDPEYMNRAATKIQANFRGYKVRKSFIKPKTRSSGGGGGGGGHKNKSKEKQSGHEKKPEMTDNNDDNDYISDLDSSEQSEKAATKIQASFRSFKERQRFHQQKRAAITIQANIRGYLTRKRLANLRRRSFQRRRSSSLKQFQKELEDMKKVNEAATKIQAVFRGYQVRSKILSRSSSLINEHEQIIDE